MDIKLIVRESFAGYAKGQEITDAETISAILSSEQAKFVIKVAA